MTITVRPIEWKAARYGFEDGLVNGLDLFKVGYGSGKRDDPKPIVAESRIPGYRDREHFADLPAAKEWCEKVLAAFVAKVAIAAPEEAP